MALYFGVLSTRPLWYLLPHASLIYKLKCFCLISWDEREKIADPEATKPEDWDEDAPKQVKMLHGHTHIPPTKFIGLFFHEEVL